MADLDLLGARPARRRKAPASGTHQFLVDEYYRQFVACWGFRPACPGGRVAAVMKKYAAAWGQDGVLEVLAEFFDKRSAFPQRGRFSTIGSFDLLAQDLRIWMTGRRRAVDPRTAANADAARRATTTGRAIGPKE